MRRHGLAWVHASVQGQRYPTEVGMQHTPAETADFLATARRDWAAVPVLAAAFDAYERVVADIWTKPAASHQQSGRRRHRAFAHAHGRSRWVSTPSRIQSTAGEASQLSKTDAAAPIVLTARPAA